MFHARDTPPDAEAARVNPYFIAGEIQRLKRRIFRLLHAVAIGYLPHFVGVVVIHQRACAEGQVINAWHKMAFEHS